jgi:hypothetical protein
MIDDVARTRRTKSSSSICAPAMIWSCISRVRRATRAACSTRTRSALLMSPPPRSRRKSARRRRSMRRLLGVGFSISILSRSVSLARNRGQVLAIGVSSGPFCPPLPVTIVGLGGHSGDILPRGGCRNQIAVRAFERNQGGWEHPGVPFPNMETPRLSADGCDRGAFILAPISKGGPCCSMIGCW